MLEARFAVADDLGCIAPALQHSPDRVTHRSIIFDDQDAHSEPS
jgi:hypothetical protein